MTPPEIGDLAPDFTLPGFVAGERRDFTLSAERGRPVVLAFYPGDDTPVCTRQLCSYQDDLSLLTGLDAAVWGISAQDVDSHERFAIKRGLTFPLVADTAREVQKLYGVGPILHNRAVFVVDGEGRVAWKHVSLTGLSYQGADRIASALRGLSRVDDTYPSEPPSEKRSRRDA